MGAIEENDGNQWLIVCDTLAVGDLTTLNWTFTYNTTVYTYNKWVWVGEWVNGWVGYIDRCLLMVDARIRTCRPFMKVCRIIYSTAVRYQSAFFDVFGLFGQHGIRGFGTL